MGHTRRCSFFLTPWRPPKPIHLPMHFSLKLLATPSQFSENFSDPPCSISSSIMLQTYITLPFGIQPIAHVLLQPPLLNLRVDFIFSILSLWEMGLCCTRFPDPWTFKIILPCIQGLVLGSPPNIRLEGQQHEYRHHLGSRLPRLIMVGVRDLAQRAWKPLKITAPLAFSLALQDTIKDRN